MSAIAASAPAMRSRVIASALGRARASLGVWHWRHGWCWSIALAILSCAAIVEFAKNQSLGAELSALNRGATRAGRASTPTVPLRLSADPASRAREIEALLRDQGSFESQYQRLIEIAARRGIQLPRADYVTTTDEPGGMLRVQVSLSIAARYPQFRSFIEEVLRTLPATSLDQFSVKRDNVAQAQVEVLVRMSFWATREPLVMPTPQRGTQATRS